MKHLVASANLVWCNNFSFEALNTPLADLIKTCVKPGCVVGTTLQLHLGMGPFSRSKTKGRQSKSGMCCLSWGVIVQTHRCGTNSMQPLVVDSPRCAARD